MFFVSLNTHLYLGIHVALTFVAWWYFLFEKISSLKYLCSKKIFIFENGEAVDEWMAWPSHKHVLYSRLSWCRLKFSSIPDFFKRSPSDYPHAVLKTTYQFGFYRNPGSESSMSSAGQHEPRSDNPTMNTYHQAPKDNLLVLEAQIKKKHSTFRTAPHLTKKVSVWWPIKRYIVPLNLWTKKIETSLDNLLHCTK